MAVERFGLVMTVLVLGACASVGSRPVAEMDAALEGEFSWAEALPPGARLSIRNVQGPIEVRGADGPEAVVRAEGVARGSGSRFRVQLVRDGRDVTVCIVYSEDDVCEFEAEWGYRRADARPAEQVRIVVQLPERVDVRVRSDHGEVTVRDASGNVEAVSGFGRVHVVSATGTVYASTGSGAVQVDHARGPVYATAGNGNIRVSSAAGPVDANTGNGTIDVELGARDIGRAMSLSAGNGSVVLRLRQDFSGLIDASTGYGRVTSDFPLEGVTPYPTQRHVRGLISTGGQPIYLSTGHGDIRIVRAGNR